MKLMTLSLPAGYTTGVCNHKSKLFQSETFFCVYKKSGKP